MNTARWHRPLFWLAAAVLVFTLFWMKVPPV